MTPRRRRGARDGVLPFALLTATDCLVIATLALCFTGPGELMVLVPTCLLTHLLAGGGRRLAGSRFLPDSTGVRRLVGIAGWALAVVVAFGLPFAAVDAAHFTAGLPLASAWHLAGSQLSAAWHVFSTQVSPVAESPGLVLAAGWAAGAVALASEVLYADVGLPAILALVPAFDVLVFTGTLGTTTGRALELVAVAGLAIGFLVSAQDDRRPARAVVSAQLDQGVGRTAAIPRAADQRRRRRFPAVPAVAVLAAVAAGVIGPIVPGATSAPLIAWHGAAAGRGGNSGDASGVGTGSGGGQIGISGLVSVAQQEIGRANVALVTVHSSVATREVLFTLDRFDGVKWWRIVSTSDQSRAVPGFRNSISAIEHHPPSPVPPHSRPAKLQQVITVDHLGGPWLPVPGVPSGINGDGEPSELGADGPVVASVSLTKGLTYAVQATLAPIQGPSTAALASSGSATAPPADLRLPAPIPSNIVTLAHRIAGTSTNPYQIAQRLQQFFVSGEFRYQLPRTVPKGAVANTSQSYRALDAFLFQTRTGYCQQFATAFAVLARIDHLPTRIAVGLLPGDHVAPDKWIVSGADVHAWPQVDLPKVGWVSFEPTPGTSTATVSTPTSIPVSVPGLTTPSTAITPTTLPLAHNFGHPSGGNGGGGNAHHHHAAAHRRGGGSSGIGWLLAGLLVLAVLWAIGVPTARAVARFRDRRDVRRATVGAWKSALACLAVAGAHRRRSETHREFVARVRTIGLISTPAAEALDHLAIRMDRLSYGVGDPAPASAKAARAEAAAVRRSARRRIAWWQRLLMVVDPRDLLSA